MGTRQIIVRRSQGVVLARVAGHKGKRDDSGFIRNLD